MKQVFVFDLDGTLIDSRGDIAAAANFALKSVGRAPLPNEVIEGFVGDGGRTLLAKCLELDEADPLVDEAIQLYFGYYRDNPWTHSTWIRGAPDVLYHLRDLDFRVALATNKSRIATDPVLRALGLADVFSATVAAGDGLEKKPSAAPLLWIAERLGVAPTELVMVGDGPQDVGSARAVGCPVLGINSGYGQTERLLRAKPDVVFEDLSPIAAWATRAFGPRPLEDRSRSRAK